MTDQRPRIAPASDVSPETAEILSRGLEYRGRPLNAASTLAHHPKLLKRFTVFAGLFLTHSKLPARDRELLTLRCSHRNDVEYYFGHHVETAASAGLTQDEIHGVTDPEYPWSGRDKTLIDVADELTARAVLGDANWAALQDLYDEAQTIEAVMLVGFYRMLAGYVNTVGVQLEEGMPGWPR